MRMLSKRSLAAVIVLVIATGVVAAILWRQPHPKKEFVEGLDRNPLCFTKGLAWGGAHPTLARLELQRAKQLGLDLFSAYQENGDKPAVRLSLAYLLLLDENEAYLSYAEMHEADLTQSGEWRLLCAVLEEHGAGLSSTYESRLRLVLKDSQYPYAIWINAQEELKGGNDSQGVKMLLDLVSSNELWAENILKAVAGIPENRRRELLLPYLDVQDTRGLYAAIALTNLPKESERALEYIKAIASQKSTPLAERAAAYLKFRTRP